MGANKVGSNRCVVQDWRRRRFPQDSFMSLRNLPEIEMASVGAPVLHYTESTDQASSRTYNFEGVFILLCPFLELFSESHESLRKQVSERFFGTIFLFRSMTTAEIVLYLKTNRVLVKCLRNFCTAVRRFQKFLKLSATGN